MLSMFFKCVERFDNLVHRASGNKNFNTNIFLKKQLNNDQK